MKSSQGFTGTAMALSSLGPRIGKRLRIFSAFRFGPADYLHDESMMSDLRKKSDPQKKAVGP